MEFYTNSRSHKGVLRTKEYHREKRSCGGAECRVNYLLASWRSDVEVWSEATDRAPKAFGGLNKAPIIIGGNVAAQKFKNKK